MNENLFNKYIQIQKQIKELEEDKKIIAKQCIAEMKKDNLEKVSNDLGVFNLVRRSYYSGYSDRVKKLKDELELVKQVEENEGIAKETIIETLRFQSAVKVVKEPFVKVDTASS